jgi:hypothetical protein
MANEGSSKDHTVQWDASARHAILFCQEKLEARACRTSSRVREKPARDIKTILLQC